MVYEIVEIESELEGNFYDNEGNKLEAQRVDNKYIVEGGYIERLVYRTYFDDHDSLRYFQDALRRNGVIDKLKELGISEGQSVFILDNEFEFFE